MGGTTAKVGLILDGEARTLSEFEVGAAQGSGTAVAIASGYPILGSIVDLVEVGAGGGSIAWIDSGGLPRVGPHSAGADPGPACYGRGGTEPDGHRRQRGARPDRARATSPGAWSRSTSRPRSRGDRAGSPGALGIDVDRGRRGRHPASPSRSMAEAIRLVSVERGHDPRDFTLIAFGGAGPLHANRLAAELGIPRRSSRPTRACCRRSGCSCPTSATSTVGRGSCRSSPRPKRPIGEILERLEADARDSLRTDRIARARPAAAAAARGALRRPVVDARRSTSARAVPRRSSARCARSFDERHRLAYGYALEAEPIEIVSFTVVGVGVNRSRALRVAEPDATAGGPPARGGRSTAAPSPPGCPRGRSAGGRSRRHRRARLDDRRRARLRGDATAAGMLLVSRVERP